MEDVVAIISLLEEEVSLSAEPNVYQCLTDNYVIRRLFVDIVYLYIIKLSDMIILLV